MTTARTLASSVFCKWKFHLMKISMHSGTAWSSLNFYIQRCLSVCLFVCCQYQFPNIVTSRQYPLNPRPALYVAQLQMAGRRHCYHWCSQSGVCLRSKNVDANRWSRVWPNGCRGRPSASLTLMGALWAAGIYQKTPANHVQQPRDPAEWT